MMFKQSYFSLTSTINDSKKNNYPLDFLYLQLFFLIVAPFSNEPLLSVWWVGKHWTELPRTSILHYKWREVHVHHSLVPSVCTYLGEWSVLADTAHAARCSPSAGPCCQWANRVAWVWREYHRWWATETMESWPHP